jgi:hypothetical protein
MKKEFFMVWTLKNMSAVSVIGGVFLSLVMGGCVTSEVRRSQHLEEKWQGKSAKELVAQKGHPDAMTDDGKGGKVYAYSAYEPDSVAEITKGYPSEADSGKGKDSHPGKGIFGGSRHGGGELTCLVHERYWINPEGNIYRITFAEEGH